MSNRYHLSYDAICVDGLPENNRSNEVRSCLLELLFRRLNAENIKRPTQSTIVFDTVFDDKEVSSVVETWRRDNDVYYYLSKVADNYDNAGAGYLRRNVELDNNIRTEYFKIKENNI